MNEYEAKRADQIARNKALLAGLAITKAPKHKTTPQSSAKRKRFLEDQQPARKSARIATQESLVSYRDVSKSPPKTVKGARVKKAVDSKASILDNKNSLLDVDSSRKHPNIDYIRSGWTSWVPTAPPPTRDENDTFHFADHPDFLPNKSPQEVIQEGSFGGQYWRPVRSMRLGIVIEDDYKELPLSWLSGVDIHTHLINPVYDPTINKYGVKSGQTIEEWESNGWINYEHDIRGFFQWYCRFYQGRRCEDDERQIRRWSACTGETGRWRNILLKKYVAAGIRTVSDEGLDDEVGVSPTIHQTLHHWAWEVRQDVLDDYWESR